MQQRHLQTGTAFTTTVDGVDYQFVTTSDRTAANSGNSVNFDSVDILRELIL